MKTSIAIKRLHKGFALLCLLAFLAASAFSQELKCLGEKKDLIIIKNKAFVKASIGEVPGMFQVDFGTQMTTIDVNGFMGSETTAPNKGTISTFDNFNFYGPLGQANLIIKDYRNFRKSKGFKQAGVLGTDVLASDVFTLDYEKKALYRASADSFCKDEELLKAGFKPLSTAGYYTYDHNSLHNWRTENIPTVPVKIGKASAVARIDPGYIDSSYCHSVNINEAFYKAIRETGVQLQAMPSADHILKTCSDEGSEFVKAYKLPSGVSFEMIGTSGDPVVIASDAILFLMQSPKKARHCPSIGSWTIPAAQIGASFLVERKRIIFDPVSSRVWLYTK